MPNHQRKYGWSGPRVLSLRKHFARKIAEAQAKGEPLRCKFCRKPVLIGQEWDIDHTLALDDGGSLWDIANMAPAHSSCNSKDGGQISQRKRGRIRKWD